MLWQISIKTIRQNKFDENTWNAYYEGKIEPFAIQLSLVMTNMSFTERERACGNAIFFSANRLQYASNATKLSVSTQLFDRALLNRNGVMDIWNMAHVEDGEKYYIRKEYLFVPMATEAMVKAIEIAIFNGTGEGQPLGVTKDSRVTTVVTLTQEEYESWNGWHKVKGKMKKAYRNGSFVMNQSTFDTGIDGMEDKNGQPIGRTNYGVNGEETYRFMGKNVETVEDDVLPSWDDANEGDVIAVFMSFSDYVINTNMEMQVVKWTDHDNNKIKNKCLMVVDGKVADANGIILVKKGVRSV